MKEFNIREVLKRIDELITDKFGSDHGRQKLFSKFTGINNVTLNSYFVKGNAPGADTLFKIANKCNVNLNWLLTGNGDKYIQEEKHPPGIEIEKLVSLIPDSNDSDVKAFHSIVDNWENFSVDERRKLRHQLEAFLIEAKTVLSQKEDPPPKFSVSVIEIPDRDDVTTVRPSDLLPLQPPKRRH